MNKTDLKSLSEEELREGLKRIGEEPYRARQIFRWLYKTSVRSFDEMTDLAKESREKLKTKFHITHLVTLDSKRSKLDGTTKYLFKLEDSNTIETVFLPEKSRTAICLSSQVGCKYGCSFCASAPFGFVRNLLPSEILDEVLAVRRENPRAVLTNLVFMGIGEPFDNYYNVMKAVRIFNDKDAFNIGARRITISTCGIIPGIERLGEEGLQIELAVSLHSADDRIRSELVPINKKYPLKDLIGACKKYIDKTNRVITFEYILIKDVNSSRADAIQLARLIKGMKCKVNTISYNQIKAKGYNPPSRAQTAVFLKTLRDSGINAISRKSKGEDIDAGCGQLRISEL
jgi:23S rRNA (adenine2503-C2)-methyltransferase